ncbi:MAG: hypothetical protein HYT71_01845 [Candidatus Aenigmarchaeota archaeon]|nr:hypothetical protein [Candidatus Aenigmarchaeota archaeon]
MVTTLGRPTTGIQIKPITRLSEDDGSDGITMEGGVVAITENRKFSGLVGFMLAESSSDSAMHKVDHYRVSEAARRVLQTRYTDVQKTADSDGRPYYTLMRNGLIIPAPSRMPYEYCPVDGKDFTRVRTLLSGPETFDRGLAAIYDIVTGARPNIFKMNGHNLEMPEEYANLIPRTRQ